MNAWSFFSLLIWQIILAATLWYLREPLIQLLLRRKISAKWNDKEITIEGASSESSEKEMREAAKELQAIIRRKGPHSFEYFRNNTNIRYSDEEFHKIIETYPDCFQEVRIIQHDQDGNRIIPGRPGIRLLS